MFIINFVLGLGERPDKIIGPFDSDAAAEEYVDLKREEWDKIHSSNGKRYWSYETRVLFGPNE